MERRVGCCLRLRCVAAFVEMLALVAGPELIRSAGSDRSVAPDANGAGGFVLVFSPGDGWELYDGDEFVVGHDGFDAGDVTAAQAWASAELSDEQRTRIVGWRPQPNRRGRLEYAVMTRPECSD